MNTTTPLQIPAQLGRYRIVKMIGAGGMGAVYLARDTQLDRDVALKIPQFHGQDAVKLLERFDQEARAAATVQHPNICPIYDFGEIDGVHFLTMAYIDGQPLEKWASGEKALTPRQLAALVRKVAAAMHEAHKKGVIHRDLKPANIMIDRRGEPVVMDFGLARRVREGDQRLTQSGAIMGSPAYMAPEQVKGDQKVIGPASDIYALGVILYELLTHRLPFQGPDNLAVLAQVLMDEPPVPSSLRPDLEKALEAICLKAMAKKIEDRYASMAELAAALLDYLRGGQPPATPRVETATVPPAAGSTPAAGMRVSQMGGLRSMARMPAPVPPQEKSTSVRRPRRKKERAGRLPIWPWIAGGAVILGLLFVALILTVFRSNHDGTIRISVAPAAARVTILVDGKPGATDEEMRLTAGTHQLSVSGGDFEDEQRPFTIRQGANPDLQVTLRPKKMARNDANPPGPRETPPPQIPPTKPAEKPPMPSAEKPPPRVVGRGEQLHLIHLGEGKVHTLNISADSRTVLVSYEGNHTRLFDLQTGKDAAVPMVGYVSGFATARLEIIAGANERARKLQVYDLRGNLQRVLPLIDDLWFLVVSPRGDRVVHSSPTFDRLLNTATGKEIKRWTRSERGESVFSTDGKYVLFRPDTRGPAPEIVRRADTGEEMKNLDPLKASWFRGFFPDERKYAMWTDAPVGRNVQSFEVAGGGKEIGKVNVGTLAAKSWRLSPDGKRIIVLHADHNVRVWDFTTGEEVCAFPAFNLDELISRCCAITPDNKYACAAGRPGWLYIWRLPEPR